MSGPSPSSHQPAATGSGSRRWTAHRSAPNLPPTSPRSPARWSTWPMASAPCPATGGTGRERCLNGADRVPLFVVGLSQIVIRALRTPRRVAVQAADGGRPVQEHVAQHDGAGRDRRLDGRGLVRRVGAARDRDGDGIAGVSGVLNAGLLFYDRARRCGRVRAEDRHPRDHRAGRPGQPGDVDGLVGSQPQPVAQFTYASPGVTCVCAAFRRQPLYAALQCA